MCQCPNRQILLIREPLCVRMHTCVFNPHLEPTIHYDTRHQIQDQYYYQKWKKMCTWCMQKPTINKSHILKIFSTVCTALSTASLKINWVCRLHSSQVFDFFLWAVNILNYAMPHTVHGYNFDKYITLKVDLLHCYCITLNYYLLWHSICRMFNSYYSNIEYWSMDDILNNNNTTVVIMWWR